MAQACIFTWGTTVQNNKSSEWGTGAQTSIFSWGIRARMRAEVASQANAEDEGSLEGGMATQEWAACPQAGNSDASRRSDDNDDADDDKYEHSIVLGLGPKGDAVTVVAFSN